MKPAEPHSLLNRATMILLFSVLLVGSLYYARAILIPFTIAALTAMLLLPMVRWLEKRKFNKFFSILVSIIFIIAFLGLLIFILSTQMLSFSTDMPLIQQKLRERLIQFQEWIAGITGVSVQDQLPYIDQATNSFFGIAKSLLSKILFATASTVVFFGLVIILIFLFLYYRQRIRNFLLHLIPREQHIDAGKIISEVSLVTQKYLTGVFIVMAILSVLNSILFLIVGVPHAIFFGVAAAILNIVPYVGVWVGTLLPVIMMAATQDSLIPILVIFAGVWANQQLDNNYLTPKITGSQVSINPLATIVILVIGSMIWGVAGMILFIPMLGVAKIICDNVEGLKPLGYLIGEDVSSKRLNIIRYFHNQRKQKKQSQG